MTNIPEGAELVVEDVAQSKYDDYLNQAAAALRTDADAFTYAKLLDISIVYEGQEIQPNGKVGVEIQLKDGKDISNPQVVHFGQKTEVLDAAKTENGVAFATTGFSVYAVVDGDNENARMTIKFVKGSDEIASMIVKNTDTSDEIKKIIYDPGAGELQLGEIFMGWSLDKAAYTTEDAEAESTASNPKNIDDIRAWAKNQASSIKEGDEHTFYAMIFQAHTVSYRDEEGTTISGETLIYNGTDGFITYTVNESYTPKTQDQDFKGWYWSPVHAGETDLVKDKNGVAIGSNTPIENMTEVQIFGDVIFTPYAPNGKWVIFNQNGSGASYTPPQFVLTNGKATKPSDPTRVGYTFEGWYEAQGYDADGNPNKDEYGNILLKNDKFDFNVTIEERTRLYAKWISAKTADFTVIIWKERAADTFKDNASEGKERNYDYWKSYTLTGNVGEVITAVSNSTIQTTDINGSYYDVRVSGTNSDGDAVSEVVSETGYHTAKYDQNVKVTAEGTAILNVYYDRHTVRYTFYYPYTSGGYTYNVSTGDNDNNPQKYGTFGNGYFEIRWRNGRWQYDAGWVISDWRNYNGTVYTRGEYQEGKWTQYRQETGLYGETLNWPTDTSIAWYENHDGGEVQNPRMTYKSSFLPNGSNMDVGYWGAGASGNGSVTFYTQDVTGGDHYTEQMTVKVEAGNRVYFQINDKFTGFVAHQYRYRTSQYGDWTSWTNVGTLNPSTGIYGDAIYYGRDLEIRYRRLSNTITFMDGAYYSGNGTRDDDLTGKNGKLLETDPYFYEDSLTSYNSDGDDYYVPTNIPEGYVFAGWFSDKTCTVPYKFTTMPVTGVTVYAKWVQKQYRVFMYPNVPESDNSLDWGDQGMSYRVDYGEKPAGGNTIIGTRDEYEFIGWYLDEALTKPYNFEAYELRDDTKDITGEDLLKSYDKTQSTELNKYGVPTELTNKDVDRFWIEKKLELYGKWRAKLNGARGIRVEFDAVQGKGYFPSDGGNKTLHSDGLYYLDKSEAVATSSPTASKPDEQFLYWVVQTWNKETNAYEDVTGKIVYPGDSFDVLKANAREEELSPSEDDYDPDTNYTKLTVRLRAEYGPKEALTPTHIYWYANNDSEYSEECETTDTEYMVRSLGKDDKELLEINEAVTIKPADTFAYEGYEFIGWARLPEPEDATTVERDDHPELGENDLFLKYDKTTGTFSAQVKDKNGSISWKTVTEVAADEVAPYHDLYAVWKPLPFSLTITKTVSGSLDYITIPEKGFHIEVTFDKAIIGNVTIDTADGTVAKKAAGNVYDLYLKANSSKPQVSAIFTILSGTTYSVKEVTADIDGRYTVKYNGETADEVSGKITEDTRVIISNAAPDISKTGLDIDTTAAKTALLSLFAFAIMCALGFSLKRRYVSRR